MTTYRVVQADGVTVKSDIKILHDAVLHMKRLNKGTTKIVAVDGHKVRPLTVAEEQVVAVLVKASKSTYLGRG